MTTNIRAQRVRAIHLDAVVSDIEIANRDEHNLAPIVRLYAPHNMHFKLNPPWIYANCGVWLDQEGYVKKLRRFHLVRDGVMLPPNFIFWASDNFWNLFEEPQS